MPKTNKDKVKATWRWVILLSIIFFVAILVQDIARESIVATEEVLAFSNSLNEDLKNDIKIKVESTNLDIEHIISESDEDMEEHLIHEVNVVNSGLSQTLSLLESEPVLLVETELVNYLQDFASRDNKHEYFLLKTDGTLLFDGVTQQAVNIDVSDTTDKLNRTYYQNLIDQLPSEIITENVDLEVDNEDIRYKYIGVNINGSDYVLLVRGDVYTFINNRVQDHFLSYRHQNNQESQTFVIYKPDGEIYFHNIEGLENESVYELIEQEKYVNEIVLRLETTTRGYLNEDNLNGYKISDTGYFEYNDNTDLIVLVIEDASSQNELVSGIVSSNFSNILTFFIPFYVFLTIIVFIVVRKIIKNTRLSDKVNQEEHALSQTLANVSQDFIIITNKQGYIQYMNDLVIKTIFKEEPKEQVNLDNLMVEEEGFKVLIGMDENYYIKHRVLPIMYNSEESDLYVIKDVTEEVTKERKLEKLTLQDDLTKLGNRRQLVRDYNDFILPHIKDGQKAFIAMIDLDNFKQANDNYGHAYGDEVLSIISGIFKEVITSNLRIYRVGGDEFSLLAINTTQNTLLSILRKLRNKVSNYKYREDIDISFSGGLVEINIKSEKRRLADYYDKADELLYIAKKEGKGKVKI